MVLDPHSPHPSKTPQPFPPSLWYQRLSRPQGKGRWSSPPSITMARSLAAKVTSTSSSRTPAPPPSTWRATPSTQGTQARTSHSPPSSSTQVPACVFTPTETSQAPSPLGEAAPFGTTTAIVATYMMETATRYQNTVIETLLPKFTR
jgi:hypothetical protein